MRCAVCLRVLDGSGGPVYPLLDDVWVHTRKCARFIDQEDVMTVFHTQRTLVGNAMDFDEYMALVQRAFREAHPSMVPEPTPPKSRPRYHLFE